MLALNVFMVIFYTAAQEVPVQGENETPPVRAEHAHIGAAPAGKTPSDGILSGSAPAGLVPETSSGETARRALSAAETGAEKHREDITEEASAQLFTMDLWNTDVSLYLNGYWKGSLSLNWGLANSPLGTAPETKDSPLLFTQEADLTLSLWIWQKFFLEVSFIDDYNMNTYRAGYQGFPGETVQYVGVGNTGLDFPVFPYLDLGGDSTSSFGIYGRFGSDELKFHTLVRYDAAAREERTFVGNRERSFSTVIPNNPLRGRSFVLPDENISSIPVVYFEDEDGLLSGGGRRWRLANNSEYAVSAVNGLVELVREHPGMIAVSYAGGYSLGDYTAPASFLGEVQSHFGPGIDLSSYPQPGGSTTPARITIGGISVLVIYEPGTFSPFERLSRYMGPASTTEDAALINLSSGERLDGYEVLPANTLSMDIGLYLLTGDDTERSIFEIMYRGSGRNRRSFDSLWPLAPDHPELYLPGSPAFTGDMRLRFTSYGAAGAYNIGTDAIPGSVQVYRGGILDSEVRYDAGSGTVTLTSPVGFNEVIRITYLRRSEERRLGSLAAGVGLNYTPEGSPFSAEAALGIRWNISQEDYTEEGASSPGTVGFGAKTSWDYDNLKTSLSLGLGFEQPDTTGLYRVAGMEGNSEIVMALSSTSGFISEPPAEVDPDFPPGFSSSSPLPSVSWPIHPSLGDRGTLVYRNYRETNVLGASELTSIYSSAPVVSGLEGPYPAKDGNMEIYAAEFENLENGAWTGFQVPLGGYGALLEQAKGIVVPIRFYQSSPVDDILVVAQFGALAAEGSGGTENSNLMVEVPLFYGTPSSSWIDANNVSGGKYVAVSFTDEMRRKLRNANHMRILIINLGQEPLSNRLLVAKPFIMGASWRGIRLDGGNTIKTAGDAGANQNVSVMEGRDLLLYTGKIKRLHSNAVNHVLQVSWTGMDSAGADGRTSVIPLANYRVLSFYLKKPPDGTVFHFLVSRGPNDYPGKTALELAMSSDQLSAGWNSVEIHYRDKKVLVNGINIPLAQVTYNPDILRENQAAGDFIGDGRSGYAAAFVTGTSGQMPGGSFSIDEICLEDPAPVYRLNGGASLDWHHPEALISAGDREVVSGAVFSTAVESAARGNPFESGGETFTGMQSRSGGEVTVLDTKLEGNLNFMVSSDSNYWSAGHGIERSFGPLTVSENFNTAPPPNDATMNHSLSLGLATPVYGNMRSSVDYQNRRLSRLWSASTGVRPEQDGHPGFSLEGTVNYLEKTSEVEKWMPGYGETWTQSWKVMLPDDGAGTENRPIQNRDMQGRAGFILDRRPVGAELSFDGSSFVSVPLWLTRNGSSARIEAPFGFGNIQGRLRSQRDISRSLNSTGENIADDMVYYGQSLSDTSPLWRQIPVYALFNSDLDSAMDKSLANSGPESPDNVRFHEVLALNLLFPERYDALSFIIPVSHFTQLDRTMEQRMDTRLDVLTVSSGFGFSSINLFGAMGSHPVFDFYRNDELRQSLTGMISFPRDEDPLWKIQAEQNLTLFGFNGAEFGIQNTYTFNGGSTEGWIESFALIWTIPREKTLLSSLYSKGLGKLAGNNNFPLFAELAVTGYERFLRESLELVLDNSGEYSVYSLFLGHESVVRIVGRLTLTGFAKIGLERDEEAEALSLMLSFGTTLTVSF